MALETLTQELAEISDDTISEDLLQDVEELNRMGGAKKIMTAKRRLLKPLSKGTFKSSNIVTGEATGPGGPGWHSCLQGIGPPISPVEHEFSASVKKNEEISLSRVDGQGFCPDVG